MSRITEELDTQKRLKYFETMFFDETKSAVSITNYVYKQKYPQNIVQYCIEIKDNRKSFVQTKAKVVFLYSDRMWGDTNNNTFCFSYKNQIQT